MFLFIPCDHPVIANFTSFMSVFSKKHVLLSHVPTLAIFDCWTMQTVTPPGFCFCLSAAPRSSVTSPGLQWQRLQGSHLTDTAFVGIWLFVQETSACLLLLNDRSRCLLHTQCPLALNILSFLSSFGSFSVMRRDTLASAAKWSNHSCPLDIWSVPNTAQPTTLTLSFYLILKLQLLV